MTFTDHFEMNFKRFESVKELIFPYFRLVLLDLRQVCPDQTDLKSIWKKVLRLNLVLAS